MRSVVLALAVVCTFVLSAIAVELYRIDRSLAYISAPVRALSTVDATAAGRAESQNERIERKRRVVEESANNIAEWLAAADGVKVAPQGKSATAQRTPR